jgi:predicted nucleic acid-binding protein
MSVFRQIVLDTNVFVAAGFNPRSHAAGLLAAVRGGALILAWHAETRAETLHVLSRIPPLRKLDVAELFRPDAEYTALLDLTPYGCIPDPADRVFAALAEAACAALVTNDAHLLDHRHALRVPVLPPRVFWETWVRGAENGDGERGAPPWRTHDDD